MSEPPVDRMVTLNNQALDDIRGLHFQAARYWLEVALTIAETAEIEHHEATARTYVHLAIVYATGYRDREAALERFLLALKINPSITITPGFETPVLRSVYLQARERLGLPPIPDLTLGTPGQEPSPRFPLSPSRTATPEHHVADRGSAPAMEIDERRYQRLLETAGLLKVEDPDPPARATVPLHCPMPIEVPYGEPLVVRCLTQKLQRASSAVFYYRMPGAGATYEAMPMERSPRGWLVAIIPGTALLGTSLAYYVKAEVPGMVESIYLGFPEDPNAIIIKQPKDDVAGEAPAFNRDNVSAPEDMILRAPTYRAPGAWWFALGVGSGAAVHGRETVDSNSTAQNSKTPVAMNSGFSPAGLGQLEPEIGYQLSKRISISMMGRLQVAPKDGQDDTQSADEKAIRTWALAGFVRTQFAFASKGNWQPRASAGFGFGTSFLATIARHCPKGACALDHSDTLHGGPMGLLTSVGVLYHLGPRLGVFADVNAIATLPKFMALSELSIGMAYTYGPQPTPNSFQR